jgi:hypothetical protein
MVTRGVDPDLLAAIAAPFHPVMLVQVDWPGGMVRVHSGLGDLTWNGHTWTGVGTKGEVRLPQEGTGLAADDGLLRIGGLPDEIDAYLDADVRGRAVDVWFGATTVRAGTVLVSDPVQVFTGYVDGLSDETAVEGKDLQRTINVSLGSGPPQRSRANAVHSYEDQIAAYPGDTGFRWAKAANAAAGTLVW